MEEAMDAIIIPGAKKPEKCGYHVNRYQKVITCPFARRNGACRFQEIKKGEPLSFGKQYAACPILSAKKTTQRTMTNCDAFRFMETEKMAEFLATNSCPPNDSQCPDGERPPDKTDCTACWLRWLREEVV